MAEIWRQIFAPEAYVDVVNAVMLHPDRAVSTSSLWSGGSTEVSEPSSRQKSVDRGGGGFKGLKREAESSPMMQSVDLEMEDVIKPRLEATSKRRAIEVKSPSMEPAHKVERLLQVPSTPGDTSTPRSVSFSEVTDTIGVSDTLNKQFQEDALMRKRDFGRLKPREEVKVENIPAATSARAMSWDKFIEEEPRPEVAIREEEAVETAMAEDKIQSEETAKLETESFFECEPQKVEVPSPSPAGEYSLTDLSLEIQEKLAKYIEPVSVPEPTSELKEPTLVGVQALKESRLRPIKFGRHERRASSIAVPDVIKLNLPPLNENFNEVAVLVPTGDDEQVEIKVPVEQIKEAVSRGEIAQVPIKVEMDNVKVETEIEAVPVQKAIEAHDEWKTVGGVAQPIPHDVQTGGVEIAIPFQNVFEALHEQVPVEEIETKTPLKEDVIKEQGVSVEPATIPPKQRKKTKRAKKRERALQQTRGKPLLEEQPEVKVSEVKRLDGRQSVIIIESTPQGEKRPIDVEEQRELEMAKSPRLDEATVAETKPRQSIVEIKVVPSEEQGVGTVVDSGKVLEGVSEKPRVLAKSQGTSKEWTAVGEAKVVSLGKPETKKLEILLPTENVFEPLEGEKESTQEMEVVSLPKPIAPRGQPHKAEHEQPQEVHAGDDRTVQPVSLTKADQQEQELRRSIILSPARPLTIRAGEQRIVLKSIPSSVEPSKEIDKSQAVAESDNQKVISAVHDDIQRFRNELVNHLEQLDNNFESKNRELSQQLTSVSDQLAQLQQSLKEPREEHPLTSVKSGPVTEERAAEESMLSATGKNVPVAEPFKPTELTPLSQPTELSLSSLYTERIGLCNHPSVNLEFFEPSLFETTEPAPKRVQKRHPSVDLTHFEPSLFATPEVTGEPEAQPLPRRQKAAETKEEPSLLSKIAKGLGILAETPTEAPEKYEAGIGEAALEEYAIIPSAGLQELELPPRKAPEGAVEVGEKLGTKTRHPSVDLQYFEPSMFATPKGKSIPKEIRKVHPSVELTPFEPSLFATPIPTKKPVETATLKPTERVIGTGIVDSRVKAIEGKEPLPVSHAPPTNAPGQAKTQKVHPSVDLQYFEPSLFYLPEPVPEKKKKRSWIKKIVDKLFKRKKSEKYLAEKRVKKEAKAAKKEEKKRKEAAKKADKLAKKEAKKSKAPETIQLEPIEASQAKPKTHPSVDLTFFEPSLFATPTPKPSEHHIPITGSKGIAPIAMATPLEQSYTHYARPVVMQQPAHTPSNHEENVQRLRQPSKVTSGRSSIDLQLSEPSLLAQTPEFKRPQAKEKSPLMKELDEMPVPEMESVWSVLLAGNDTPDLRQQARELILAGSGIPTQIRPSLWLTLSGGAPTHTVCYRRLSRQSEPIKDNLYAMTKRLSTALDSYYKSLSGHSFEYSLESFVIHLITRTVQLPDSGAPLDSAILYQEEQTFALALNLLYGQKYRLAAVFTRHGLREWCYELDRILEHEDNIVHPPSLTFAAPWFQGLFFNAVKDEQAGLILDWFILEGRSVLFRLAVAMESNQEYLFDIARDLKHITNAQLDTLHDSFESAWEQRRLQLHHEHKERSEVDHELAVLNSISNLDKEIQRLYHSQHQLRNKLGQERDQKTMLEHANEDLIYRLHHKSTSGRQPHL